MTPLKYIRCHSCVCCSSSALHHVARHESASSHWISVCHVASHAWVCVSLSRLSSDVLKGLMSGAQATLPPHLQLAFSGKRWARDAPAACMRAFAAFFIFSRVESQCLILTLSLSLSVCVCRCQSNSGRRLEEEDLMTSQNSDPGLTPPIFMHDVLAVQWDGAVFYTYLNIDAD